MRSIVGFVAATAFCGISVASLRTEPLTPCAPLPTTQRQVSPSAGQTSRAFTIASLNLAGQPNIGDALETWTQSRGIDVLLLQEVGHRTVDGNAFVAALSERLNFHSVYAPANPMEGNTQGLAIVSRYPLSNVRVLPLAYHHLRFRSRCRIALFATIATTDAPVHLVNVHLDTRINSHDRLAQLAPVLEALDGDHAPQLIGGDFNTMNIRWFRTMWPLVFLQRQVAAVDARLSSGGFNTPFKGAPATYKFFHLPLRLDWLYLKRLTPLDWNVDTIPLTDHRGVWARVSL
jgi:endonuclease/exonuclease/phosphatase family metal-dependent hydrolase